MDKLKSQAEQFADKARELPAFKNFSLPGVKEQVAQLLALIGKVKGVFSTYTNHDIDHVDKMLSMLDWLIPQETKTKMTSPDWLLIVLAAYLHDLGMVVTEREYTNRHENPKFEEFLKNIKNDPENKDYLDRIEKFDTEEEREVFFFQEYIRLHHASRVREWINGRHSTQWSDDSKIIADEIKKLLETLPTRFRENLADICASHHSDNLDKSEYFPLTQRYGTNTDEVANVQYAAILLRTIDLLHITKDRTPSIMYKIIKLSDPKGVDEWAKQNETFSVNMKYREFDLNNTETHIIVVSADFSEERGYFPLAEYLAYSRTQLEQSRRWADASQKTNDGKNYYFPWQTIQTDIRVEGNEPVQMRFEFDRGRLLDLLVGHTIYNDPTVVVRELLQNSIDAVRYQNYLDNKAASSNHPDPVMGQVNIIWDKEKRELVIEDQGIGMNLDVITFNLMKVGASFYSTPKFQSENADFTPISRFGIGVLTCFMVSDNIEITTCQRDFGYRIRMSSVQADYLIKRLDIGNPTLNGIAPHGTRVKLQLRKSIDLSKRNILDIVKHWVILPPCQISYIENNEAPINIGFNSPGQALKYFYSQGEEAILKDEKDFDIVESVVSNEGATYHLAFAVSKRFTPERNFKVARLSSLIPAVCIEGIRASHHFPGFSGISGSICGLLSVQGNKKFKTTVSRMDLEVDDEFIKVSEICGNILFDHIKSEVKRISTQFNRPLSQASTAGSWIYSRLRSAVSLKTTLEALDKQYKKLPLIVVETVETINGKVVTNRDLLSQENLAEIESFWTVESRLVNYLGIISRDMGKELSLNDFLSTLAPDFRDPRIKTVLPDAEEFKNEILSSHTAIRAEYSRRYQQTLIEWRQSDENTSNLLIQGGSRNIKLENAIDALIDEIAQEIGLRRQELNFSSHSGLPFKILIAPITGDLKDVFILKSHISLVVDPKSFLADLIQCISLANEKLSQDFTDYEASAVIDITLKTLIRSINSNTSIFHKRRSSYFSIDDEVNYSPVWKRISEKLNSTFQKLQIDFQVPDRIDNIIGKPHSTFDASEYWMNWSESKDNE